MLIQLLLQEELIQLYKQVEVEKTNKSLVDLLTRTWTLFTHAITMTLLYNMRTAALYK